MNKNYFKILLYFCLLLFVIYAGGYVIETYRFYKPFLEEKKNIELVYSEGVTSVVLEEFDFIFTLKGLCNLNSNYLEYSFVQDRNKIKWKGGLFCLYSDENFGEHMKASMGNIDNSYINDQILSSDKRIRIISFLKYKKVLLTIENKERDKYFMISLPDAFLGGNFIGELETLNNEPVHYLEFEDHWKWVDYRKENFEDGNS